MRNERLANSADSRLLFRSDDQQVGVVRDDAEQRGTENAFEGDFVELTFAVRMCFVYGSAN